MNTDHSLHFWVDIETTGLDPTSGQVLEIAYIITDADLEVVQTGEHLVRQPKGWTEDLRGSCDQFVRDMHDKSGLWRDLRSGQGKTLSEIENNVSADIRSAQRVTGLEVPLLPSGQSVQFDRSWLLVHLPRIHGLLHEYRNFDMRSVTEAWTRWTRKPAPVAGAEIKHRAWSDVFYSLNTARDLRADLLWERVL